VFGFLLATVATFSVGAAAAMADTPTGPAWPKSHNRSTLGELVFFGGFTVGLYVLIVLFGMLTARKNFTPAAPGKEIHVAGEKTPAKH
jgi:purine-cytosine permease-like protein